MARALVTLPNLELGRSGTIRSVDSSEGTADRLIELGFTPGTEITPIRKAPLGGPTAYLIRGFLIGLRATESRLVSIEPLSVP